MKKIFKRSGSSFYYFRLYRNGKEQWINTGETNRGKAQTIANERNAAAKGKLTANELIEQVMAQVAEMPAEERLRIRQELAGVLMAGTGATLPLAESWETWLNSPLKGNPSEVTLVGYQSYWHRFSRWAGGKLITHLHEVTTLIAEEYAGNLWATKVSPRTFNGHIKFLRGVFKLLKTRAGIATNPWDTIKSMELETQGRQAFTPDELKTICECATGVLRPLIAIGIYSGLRLGDAINLQWENVKEEAIEVTPSKTRRKGKQLTIPLHPVLRMVLQQHQLETGSKTGPIFPKESAGYAIHRHKLTRQIQSFLDSCGLTTNAEIAKNVHRQRRAVVKGFHSLRHSFVSLCAASKIPPSTIQALVGHASPAMTAVYTHIGTEQKQTAIAALPEITFSPPAH